MYVAMSARTGMLLDYGGVLIGAAANLFVVATNVYVAFFTRGYLNPPILLPSLWMAAQVIALCVGLPLSARALRQGNAPAGKWGEGLCIFPLLVGILSGIPIALVKAALHYAGGS